MAITQEFDLNLIPSSAPVVVHVDQYDHGTGRLVASLYNGETPYSPSSASVYVQGTKPDGKFFVSSTGVTLSGNVVTADLTEVMTQVSGRTRIQFVVTEQSGRTGTFVFFLEVQASALPNDSELSQSDFSMVEEAIEMIQQSVSDAAESAQESAGSAQASSDSAEDSEAWAKGTRDGEPVESTDETYHNNAKYWAEQAAGSASHGGHTIEDENGTQMTARTYLQFENADVVDDPTNNRTVVTPRGGTGGSTIIVSTTETSLYNKNVTISDGVNTVTEQFSASGVATFAGVTLTGTLTITSTDGTSTAHATLDVPYYGSYSKAITFFSATIHVTGDNAIFVGKTVKAVKNGVVIASATFTSATSGAEADIVVGESGTYTVECQVEWRNVQSASINVSSETTYNASLSCIATTCFLVTSDAAFANADIVVTLDGEPSATETIQFVNSEATYVAVKAGTYTFTVTYQGVPYAVTQVIGDSAPITIILQRWSATLNITTASSTLYGQSISIYKGSDLVGTTAFDNSGSASFTVHSSGTYKAVCTYDGYPFSTGDIAVTQETTYSATITYFAATLAISTTSSDLYSQTITITKGGVTVGTTAFSAQGAASYTVHETGTYTLDCEGYTATQAVSEQTTYNVSINAGLDLAAWITAGSVTGHTLNPSSYATFADLEADEAAIRQLMLVHDAVDYLATATAGDTLMQSVIGSDVCAKWINMSDYALDALYANSDIASEMATADKYGYGEWVITDSTTTPVTWGSLGNVPIMTANNAPYGTAFASSEISANYIAAFALNGVTTGGADASWTTAQNAITNQHIGYKSVNPICVKRVMIDNYLENAGRSIKQFKVQGSNDSTNGTDGTWTDLTSTLTNTETNKVNYYDVDNNDDFYLWHRLYIIDNWGQAYIQVQEIQFYGRELSALVPTMTDNTHPKGECISNNTSSTIYYAFDNNSNTEFSFIGSTPNIGYDFGQATKILSARAKIRHSSASTVTSKWKLQGSDDGFASDIHDLTSEVTVSSANVYLGYTDFICNTIENYKAYRLQNTQSSTGMSCDDIQFIGFDYSEKEFASGSTRKTIYDHGVELVSIARSGHNSSYSGINTEYPEFAENGAYVGKNTGNTMYVFVTDATIETTDYTTLNIIADPFNPYGSGEVAAENGALGYTISKNPSGQRYFDAYQVTGFNKQYSHDISNVNGNNYLGFMTINASRKATVYELWLE